ncbi:Na(+)/H(+) antiporter subunit B [Minwuia sp.]|uniref:Na(+)/H(+) antiporter subunit B n=1 Tax=Minwuia sp. TaxID=2493630 RepID=UPI003A8D1E63
MIHHLIPRVLSKLLIPFIILFGLYVQFHGDFGPGGGFQAGVIIAAGIILYALIYGLDVAEAAVPPKIVAAFVALGLLIYAGVGVATMLLGAEFLNYDALDGHDPVHGQHLGILIIEFGVGMTVASVMITIFYKFADRLHLTRELELAEDAEDI